MKTYRMLALALLLAFLSACGGTVRTAETLTLDKTDSWFSDYERRDGQVRFTCELSLENSAGKLLSGCLQACFPQDTGDLVLEDRLVGVTETQTGTELAGELPTASVLELPPGRTKLRVTFIGSWAGGEQKQDRLLPELYWTAQDGSDECKIPEK